MGVESLPTVQRASVVPDHEVADLPFMLPGECRLGRVLPECVEQSLGFSYFKSHEIGFWTPSQIKIVAFRFGMRANQRMHTAWDVAHARMFKLNEPGANVPGRIRSVVVFQLHPLDPLPQI